MGWVLVALVVLEMITAKTAAVTYLITGVLIWVVAVAVKASEK
jgi:hypothetical protein